MGMQARQVCEDFYTTGVSCEQALFFVPCGECDLEDDEHNADSNLSRGETPAICYFGSFLNCWCCGARWDGTDDVGSLTGLIFVYFLNST